MKLLKISTATGWQLTTYLLGVALFSISFLVFLNSSVSFVVTDLIGQEEGVGNAVGTLGFADELIALVACPFWGVTSDRLGVRNVCVIGYIIIGISLFLFVQARNVFPQLLLARLLFSVGGAAATTMVTAVLPIMTTEARGLESDDSSPENDSDERIVPPSSTSSQGTERTAATEATITPFSYQRRQTLRGRSDQGQPTFGGLSPRSTSGVAACGGLSQRRQSRTSQIAGLVGMFTGTGALIALGVFLPLPDRLQQSGMPLSRAVVYSYYIVGTTAFVVAGLCGLGLRNLRGEHYKGWRYLWNLPQQHDAGASITNKEGGRRLLGYTTLLFQSIKLGFTDASIGLGYLGGFVARASSVGISLFIPLFVNAYFISSGKCIGQPGNIPDDVKRECGRAYRVAAALTGVSQLAALLCAPMFGYLDGRFGRLNLPLLVASVSGIVGYIMLARTSVPDPSKQPSVFITMALLGISQIGAIVCSLSLLSRVTGDSRSISTSTTGTAAATSIETRLENDLEYTDIASPSSPSRVLPQATPSAPEVRVLDTGTGDPKPSSSHDEPWRDRSNNLVERDEASPLLGPSSSSAPRHLSSSRSACSPSGSALQEDTEQSAGLSRVIQPPISGVDHERSYDHLKGSVAGVYSLGGGAGILLLTKLGGHLFDTLTPGAPFYMLAIFNAILLGVGTICTLIGEKSRRASGRR